MVMKTYQGRERKKNTLDLNVRPVNGNTSYK